MDIKIIVATHKKYWMPEDNVYLPLHVGKYDKADLGYQGDDTGDSISYKNANYCELTGLYWAWKNLNCDYIGLCHYRRYFSKRSIWTNDKKKRIFAQRDYKKLLKAYDVIVPAQRNYYIETVQSQYEHAHYKNDLELIENIVAEDYSDYLNAFHKIMQGKTLHLYNMFVMKKTDFNSYCEWLFAILFKFEAQCDIKKYDTYQARVFGFLGERLFNIWLEKNNLRKIEIPVINLEPVNWLDKGIKFLKRKFIR